MFFCKLNVACLSQNERKISKGPDDAADLSSGLSSEDEGNSLFGSSEISQV